MPAGPSAFSRYVISIGVDAPLVDAINTMLKHGVSGLPVVDEAGKLVSILSKSDFLRRAEIAPVGTRIGGNVAPGFNLY
jgi:CBS domain-containing protein